jgi:hypothetical protein
MTGVAPCQKKFGELWFSLCNTVFTHLSEGGGEYVLLRKSGAHEDRGGCERPSELEMYKKSVAKA